MMANFLCLALCGLTGISPLSGIPELELIAEGHLPTVGPPFNPEEEHGPSVSADGPFPLAAMVLVGASTQQKWVQPSP